MSERSNSPPVEEALTKVERKKIRQLSRRGKKQAAILAIGLVGPLNPAYWIDVHNNYQELQNAELSITVESPALDPENNDSALVFLHGFNTYDAVQLTETIGPAYQELLDGEMWSVRYGNADFAEEIITREIEELAEERGVTKIAIVGYSAGGTIGSGVESNVFTNTDLDVLASLPTHSPANQASLRPYQQSELETGKVFTTLIPSSRYSKPWRWVFEMYFMRDRYLNPDKSFVENIDSLKKTGAFALRIVNRKDLPSVDTLYQQIKAIDSADITGDALAIATHAEATGKTLPVHGYVEITEPGHDYIVNNKEAASVYKAAAEQAGIQFFTIDVPTGVHSRPDINTDDYRRALMGIKTDFAEALITEYEASHSDDWALTAQDIFPLGAQQEKVPDETSSGTNPAER